MLIVSCLVMATPKCLGQYQVGDRVYSPPAFGNYFSMAHTNWPPLPFLISTNWPVYSLGTIGENVGYAYDDRDSGTGLYGAMDDSGLMPPIPDDGGGGTNSFEPDFTPLVFGSNDLYLTIVDTNNTIVLTLHGTKTNSSRRISISFPLIRICIVLTKAPVNSLSSHVLCSPIIGEISSSPRQATGNRTPRGNCSSSTGIRQTPLL